jgi:soluble lytic murein transglycosylase-like protein
VTARAEARIAMLPELQFLANTMATRDRDLYAISRAAWKYGPALERWPEVRNGTSLVMAMVHRESNFDPRAQSYGQDGQPLARGAGQINMRVWKLDRTKIEDPDYNIRHAVNILDGCLTASGGNLADALFRYWGGDRDRHSYEYPAHVLESKYFDATKHLVYQDNAVLK